MLSFLRLIKVKMIINVSVKFEKRKDKVEKINEENYFVYLKSDPLNGVANEELIKELSFYFNIDKKEIKIISGKKTRKKKIMIKGL